MGGLLSKFSQGPSFEVTAQKDGKTNQNVAVGANHGNIYMQGEDLVQDLKARTKEILESQTEKMIKMSAVDLVMKKLQNGQKWITITGNAGEGKTTLGYMVLQALKSEKVFIVDTPEEFAKLYKSEKGCTVMLNDIFGQFNFDLTSLNKWSRLIANIFEDQEKTTENEEQTSILFISRWNVLQSARDYLERYGKKILAKECIINLSESNVFQERMELLNCYLSDVDSYVKRRVANLVTPHGFPHCCKMYAELQHKGEDIDIIEFFRSPLKFLDNTTRALRTNEEYDELFKAMIQSDGKLNAFSINDDRKRGRVSKAASELDGSYIKKTSGHLSFTHPSIHESIINVIGETDNLFIVKYASLSVIMQKGKIKENIDAEDKGEDKGTLSHVKIDPVPEILDVLCERFCQQILEKDFSVFGHSFCDNVFFWRTLESKLFPDKVGETLSINEEDDSQRTMLLTAAMGGRLTAVQSLLKHGANVNQTDAGQRTALHYFCERGTHYKDALLLLFAHGADGSKTDSLGRTALHYLCMSGYVDTSTLQLLITHNADVEETDEEGMTALHYLCKSGDATTDTIQVLLDHGADADMPDWFNRTALHWLCGSDGVNADTMQLLIRNGADVNDADTLQKTPLHHLCENWAPDTNMLRLLITPDTDVNKSDADGMTALHFLCESGDATTDTIQVLLDHGADADMPDSVGRTALHCLCGSGGADADTMQLLISYGADVNKADNFEKTPLHHLCECCGADTDTLDLLITPDTDVNETDVLGKTALHHLCECGEISISTVTILINHGANVNIVDHEGNTARDCLVCEDAELAQLLM